MSSETNTKFEKSFLQTVRTVHFLKRIHINPEKSLEDDDIFPFGAARPIFSISKFGSVDPSNCFSSLTLISATRFPLPIRFFGSARDAPVGEFGEIVAMGQVRAPSDGEEMSSGKVFAVKLSILFKFQPTYGRNGWK